MGLGLNIFKDYKIKQYDEFYDNYETEYIDNQDTSVGYTNVSNIQAALELTGRPIPTYEWLGHNMKDLELVEPKEMSGNIKLALELLSKEENPRNIRGEFVFENVEREHSALVDWLEYLLEKSNEGYYLVFDWE